MHPPGTGRLSRSQSSYLRRHAHDPVDWYPWGEEAFAAARERDVPILLSIGFAACHWCRTMHAESFADAQLAAIINARFVPILVDREERPDVDALYIQALLEIGGQAGWPATLFLHPDLRPFTGVTYLPPEPRHGLPALRDVLDGVSELWSTSRDELEAAGDALRKAWLGPAPASAQRDAVTALIGLHDAQLGGFGDGAKFPQCPENELLLLAAVAHEPARRAVRRNLDEMARRALHDHLGGGFFRYCTDRSWSRPHFEKMLPDNAQLLRLYARASRLFAGGGRIASQAARRDVEVARGIARYLQLDLAHPDGGFCASEAADDPRGEGAFYTWTADEAREVVDPPLPYGIGATPTVPTVLDGVPARPVREALTEARARRPRPPCDEARIVAWNALTATGLAEAGRLLGFSEWVALAARTVRLLLDARLPDGTLPRRLGDPRLGYLEDHATLAEALLAVYQARPAEHHWLRSALELTRHTVARFATTGGFLRSTDPELPVHAPVFTDEAEPSGAGRLAEVLRQLLAYGAPVDRAVLDGLLAAATPTLRGLPAATPELHGVERALTAAPPDAPLVLVVAGPPDHPVTVQMLRAWDRTWRPHGIVALATPDAPPYALFAGKLPGPDGPRAWLCRAGACEQADTVEALEALLSR